MIDGGTTKRVSQWVQVYQWVQVFTPFYLKPHNLVTCFLFFSCLCFPAFLSTSSDFALFFVTSSALTMFSRSLPPFLAPWQATWNFSTGTIFIELDQRWKQHTWQFDFSDQMVRISEYSQYFFWRLQTKDLQQNPECGKTLEPIYFFLFLKTQSRKRHETTCIFFFGTIILWSETPNFVKSLLNRFGRCEGHEAQNKSKLHDKVSSRMHQPRPKTNGCWMVFGHIPSQNARVSLDVGCAYHFEI